MTRRCHWRHCKSSFSLVLPTLGDIAGTVVGRRKVSSEKKNSHIESSQKANNSRRMCLVYGPRNTSTQCWGTTPDAQWFCRTKLADEEFIYNKELISDETRLLITGSLSHDGRFQYQTRLRQAGTTVNDFDSLRPTKGVPYIGALKDGPYIQLQLLQA